MPCTIWTGSGCVDGRSRGRPQDAGPDEVQGASVAPQSLTIRGVRAAQTQVTQTIPEPSRVSERASHTITQSCEVQTLTVCFSSADPEEADAAAAENTSGTGRLGVTPPRSRSPSHSRSRGGARTRSRSRSRSPSELHTETQDTAAEEKTHERSPSRSGSRSRSWAGHKSWGH